MGTDSKMLAPLLLSHNNKKKVLNFNAEAIRRKIKKPIQFVFYVNKVGLFHLCLQTTASDSNIFAPLKFFVFSSLIAIAKVTKSAQINQRWKKW
jgi:hypothetical protein